MRKINIATGFLFFLTGLAIFINTFYFKQTLISDNYLGAAFFPRMVSVCLMGLSLLLAVPAFLQKEEREKEKKDFRSVINADMLRPAAGAVMLLLYLPVVQFLGFSLTTVMLFWGFLKLAGAGKVSYYIIAPVFTAAVYGVFRYLFLVQLPEGLIGF